MTLKAVIDSLDGVPEDLQGLYERGGDGKYYLDLDVRSIEALPTVRGLAEKRDELLAEKKTLAEQLEGYADIDPEEHRELKRKLKERDRKGGGKGGDELERLRAEHERELEQVRKKAAEEVDAAKAELDAERQAARRYFLDSEITRALQETGGSPALLKHVLADRLDAERTEDGTFKLVALSPAGEPLGPKDSQGTPYTARDLALELQEQDEYAPAFRASGAGGSGASPSGNGYQGGVARFDRNDPKAWGRYAEEVVEGKAVPQG